MHKRMHIFTCVCMLRKYPDKALLSPMYVLHHCSLYMCLFTDILLFFFSLSLQALYPNNIYAILWLSTTNNYKIVIRNVLFHYHQRHSKSHCQGSVIYSLPPYGGPYIIRKIPIPMIIKVIHGFIFNVISMPKPMYWSMLKIMQFKGINVFESRILPNSWIWNALHAQTNFIHISSVVA